MAFVVGFRVISVQNSSGILERWRLSLGVEVLAVKFRLVYWRGEGVHLLTPSGSFTYRQV